MTSVIKYITFDCHDPQALALFWSAALGYEIVNWDNFAAALSQAADGHLPRLAFIKVPEGRLRTACTWTSNLQEQRWRPMSSV